MSDHPTPSSIDDEPCDLESLDSRATPPIDASSKATEDLETTPRQIRHYNSQQQISIISNPAHYPDRTPLPQRPRIDYYPPSAYGPTGFERSEASDTRETPVSDYTPSPPPSEGAGSPPDGESVSTVSRPPTPQPIHTTETQRDATSVQLFSNPPVPVYHSQPQSVARYYPAPHHQAQFLAQNKVRSSDKSSSDPRSPSQTQNRTHQFLQGGVIYTPSVEDLGLHSLSDGPPGEKPPYPYPTIIRCAILGSPRQRLTLSEIYLAMENRFPWFRTAGSGWRNSVRHNLSLSKSFVKVSRPITEPGKGAYWTVDLEAGEGNKRPRKRNKKQKPSSSGRDEDENMESTPREVVESRQQQEAPTPPEPMQEQDNSSPVNQSYSFPAPPRLSEVADFAQTIADDDDDDSSFNDPNRDKRVPKGPIGPPGEGRYKRDSDSD